jgi:hypothetical protein
LIAGLMLNVYYPNAMLLTIVVVEALRQYAAAFRGRPVARDAGFVGDEPAGMVTVSQLLARHFVFAAITLACLLPTFVTRYVIYGSFVSLTPLFVLGLAVFLERVSTPFPSRRAAVASASVGLAAFIFWNAEFMFQWGAHLIPPRGPISWSMMVHNQFSVVPRQMKHLAQNYLFNRSDLMRQIEDRDIDQLRKQSTP